MVLLDFRRKLAAGEGGQVCTGPNVAHPPATDGSDGAVGDADESGASPELDAAEPEGEPSQRRPTAPSPRHNQVKPRTTETEPNRHPEKAGQDHEAIARQASRPYVPGAQKAPAQVGVGTSEDGAAAGLRGTTPHH